MKLRSRVYVRALNQKIGLYAAMYTRCRRKMILLNADTDKMKNVFRELTKEDAKASTAILKPNIPGSTKLQLSWIWHSVRSHLMFGLSAGNVGESSDEAIGVDAATRMEFNRVHWLRARAQAERWHEERLLVTYEMQWTVRSFLHKSEDWKKAALPGRTDPPGVTALPQRRDSPGAKAYAQRQAHTWLALAVISDRKFKIANKYYKSPIM
ncbi:hypothetical protein CPC08DRAFT_646869 [Agrocybe pediades]|nr:hypothetical protein CPC08DRAFT_646869 [Agrocybe pediades]